MKNYPNIKFSFKKKLEKDFFNIFPKNIQGIALPRPIGFLNNPQFNDKEKKKVLFAFIDHYYQKNRKELTENLEKVAKEWSNLEKYFYKQVDKLFYNYPWPKGEYRGYVTIANMFPRNIAGMHFSFPVDKRLYKNTKLPMIVIAHEMLHFLTYDYLIKMYRLKPSQYSDKNNKFWQFTENLNVLIENDICWRKITGGIKSQPYKDCQKLYSSMEKIWRKNKDLDNLIEKIFKVKKCQKKLP